MHHIDFDSTLLNTVFASEPIKPKTVQANIAIQLFDVYLVIIIFS